MPAKLSALRRRSLSGVSCLAVAALVAGASCTSALADTLDGTHEVDILVGASEGSVIRGHGGDDLLWGETIGRATGVAGFRSLSEEPDGTQATKGHMLNAGVFMPDGRLLMSTQSDSGSRPSNGGWDAILRRLEDPASEMVGVHKDGTPFLGSVQQTSVTADGRSFVFTTDGANSIGKPDTNRTWDVYIKDLVKGTVKPVSVLKDGTYGNGYSFFTNQMFLTGRVIPFESDSTNLWPNDNNGRRDIFAKDMSSGKLYLVSSSSLGALSNGNSYRAILSPQQDKVAFCSEATNLVPGDINGVMDVFVKDLKRGTIVRASTAANGAESNGYSCWMAWSPDGKKLAFDTQATNFVPGDTNGAWDIYEKDLESGAIRRLSILNDGTEPAGGASRPLYSPDGKRIMFNAHAALVPDDTNGKRDFYMKDLDSGEVIRVSTTPDGKQITADAFIGNASFSPDGNSLAFAVSGDEGLTTDGVLNWESYVVTLPANPGSADRLDGGVGNDRLFGAAGNDILIGGPDNDLLDGGTGADEMNGGPGNDRYFVDNAGDTIIELIGGGMDQVHASASFDLGLFEEHLTLIGTGNINAKGNKGKNVLIGNPGNNIIQGEAGKDLIEGKAGADDLRGGPGGDILSYYTSPVGVTVDLSRSTVSGGHATGDRIMEFEGILGSGRNDTLTGDAGGNIIDGSFGNDTIDGGDGADKLFGGWGDDTIIGGNGKNKITGGYGADIITPGSGGKLIYTSVFDSLPAARDRILNYDAVTGPTIDLKKIDADPATTKNDAFTYLGSGAFTGVPGQLRFAGEKLMGDVTGDGVADFVVDFPGVASIPADKFKL